MNSSQPPRKLNADTTIEEAIAAKRKRQTASSSTGTGSAKATTKRKASSRLAAVDKSHDALIAAIDEHENSPPMLLKELGERTEELTDSMSKHLELLTEVSTFVDQVESEAERIREDARQQARAEAEEILTKAAVDAERTKQELVDHSAQLLSDLHEMVELILEYADDPREAARNLKLVADKLKQRTDDL